MQEWLICGSNLHEQIYSQTSNSEELCVPVPVTFAPAQAKVDTVIALTASQILYRSGSEYCVAGFGWDHPLDASLKRSLESHKVKQVLGKDVFRALLDTQGVIFTLDGGTSESDARFSAAAMDAHGRLLAIDQDHALCLYASITAFLQGECDRIQTPFPLDANTTVDAGAAHFIVTAHNESIGTSIFGLGDNRFHQQGHSEVSSWTEARQIDFFQGISDVVKVSCGNLHTAFLTADKALYMAGSNASGQTRVSPSQEPSLLDLAGMGDVGEDVLDVASGSNHTVIATNKGIFAFGSSVSSAPRITAKLTAHLRPADTEGQLGETRTDSPATALIPLSYLGASDPSSSVKLFAAGATTLWKPK